MAEKLNKLRTQRAVLIDQQERTKEFLNTSAASASLAQLELRLQFLEKQMESFSNIQTSIEQSDDTELIASHRASYEETYYTVQPSLAILIQEKKNIQDTSSTPSPPPQSNIRLPKISLPSFNRDITEWLSYFETFKTLVHNDSTLNKIQKFQYLRSTLTGTAAKQIQSLELTEANYAVAIQIFQERYDSRKLISQAHIQSLMDIKLLEHNKPSKMRDLIDKTNVHLRALESLDRPVTHWDDLVVHAIVSKLDSTLRLGWEKESSIDRLPTLKELLAYLAKQCQIIETTIKNIKTDYHTISSQAKPLKKTFNSLVISSPSKCPMCNSGHSLYKCRSFLNKSVDQRLEQAIKLNLCKNCLRQGHNRSTCKSSGRCATCRENHHTLLHKATNDSILQGPSKSSNKASPSDCSSTLYASNSHQDQRPSYVFLATAILNVFDVCGRLETCRTILDSASQLNFVTERLVEKLGLKRKRISLSVCGIGGNDSLYCRHQTQLTLKSRLNNFSFQLNAVIVPTITSKQPGRYIECESWNLPKNIQLADPKFNEPQDVDVLIGAELHYQFLEVGQIRLKSELPVLQKTLLGWIVSGKSELNSIPSHSLNVTINSSANDPLSDQLKKFWELEHCPPIKSGRTQEEQQCEAHFQRHFKRDSSGRFIVRLPFKQDPNCLGDSYEMAKRRFLSLERRLHKNSELLARYSEFMNEYLSLNHMRPVYNLPILNYVLPHHCVLKPDSSTTKLRVVFDASAKSTTDYSLNDTLMVGPVIQHDLFSIILRFRTHSFILTADIAKMYRQIQIEEKDQKFQNILWRDHPEKTLETYQLTTVTYGTATASYLATRCLHQLGIEEEVDFPNAAAVIKSDFYVDDLITGGNSESSLLTMRNELIALLSKGGFELRKWCSNEPSLLEGIPLDQREKFVKFNTGEAVKTLGLIWQPQRDEFQFKVSAMDSKLKSITKRVVLSDISKIFDPLGLINPIILFGKIFMQELWILNLSWDESLPVDFHTKWCHFRDQLKAIEEFKIPRKVLFSTHSSVQLHAFSDASESAYGATIYIRSIEVSGSISSHLLCAKSRVAPIKKITLPRLELCAAQLMARLVQQVSSSLNNIITLEKIYYWTDSTIVLSWLRESSGTWETFIANRVAVIQELTNVKSWHHIDTTQNPADLVSRGAFPRKLLQSKLWFCGPAFLKDPEDTWVLKNCNMSSDVPGRRKKRSVLVATQDHQSDLIEDSKYKNSFLKLLNVFAYIYRFVNNCKTPSNERLLEIISPAERETALMSLVRYAQKTTLTSEYRALSKGKQIESQSQLQGLCPFMDNDGIIRVGGRLRNSELTFDAKHQMILPSKHSLSYSLVQYLHIKNLHAGSQTLLNIVRQRYWPLGGRSLTRKIVNSCVRCFKTKPKDIHQLMGDLPPDRVKEARPFLNSGVDICGPINIHFKIRGKTPVKSYIVIFICFVTKAVHLELASDLSTAAFIAALKRFIGRRGICSNLYCDNATNFVGARADLQDIRELFYSGKHQAEIIELCSKDSISFHFIPPRSPHFGGLWESAVKLTKYHLRRVMQGCLMTYEELNTLCVQVEAILNSRPLTAISNDPNDIAPLTPGHFLIGEPLTALPEPNMRNVNVSLINRWQRIQYATQQFWIRWRKDYLNQLQTRAKWTTTSRNMKVGDLVIIKEENIPPMKWLLARVVEVFPGQDGIVRVVNLKTLNGQLKRSVTKICPLPISEE